MRELPAIAVVMASIRASKSITTSRLVMKTPPPTIEAMACATPEPSTMPGAITPAKPERTLERQRYEDVDGDAEQA